MKTILFFMATIIGVSSCSHAAEAAEKAENETESGVLPLDGCNLRNLGINNLRTLYTKASLEKINCEPEALTKISFNPERNQSFTFSASSSKIPKKKFSVSDPVLGKRPIESCPLSDQLKDGGDVTENEPRDYLFANHHKTNSTLEIERTKSSKDKKFSQDAHRKQKSFFKVIEEAWAEKDDAIFLQKMIMAQKIFTQKPLRAFGKNAKDRYLTQRAWILLETFPCFCLKSEVVAVLVRNNFHIPTLVNLRSMHMEAIKGKCVNQ